MRERSVPPREELASSGTGSERAKIASVADAEAPREPGAPGGTPGLKDLAFRVERAGVVADHRGARAPVDCRDVEPRLPPRVRGDRGKVRPRRGHDSSSFGRPHGLLREAVPVLLPKAHLDEREHVFVPSDDVDLPAPGAEIPLQDPHPPLPEIRADQVFRLPARRRPLGRRSGHPGRTPRNVFRWIGEGPSIRRAARCPLVGYPLWEAKPYPG